MIDNKGRSKRKLKCKRHKFVGSERGSAETGCVDVVGVDLNALEIESVLLLERNRQIQSGIDFLCRGDCVRFAWCEELQVLFGSDCSKGERQASRCAILVGESENGTDVQSFDGSVRDERHEPRCVLTLLQQGYQSVCIPRGLWTETGARVKRSLRIASRD